MNFFKYQDQARRTSTRLVVLFALAVLAIVLAVNLAAYSLLGGDLKAQGLLSLATALVIGVASWWRVRTLRGGGALIAAQMGGTLVAADTSDPMLRRYRNVAEEMAIAAGIPVPMLFVLDDEAGINAFAAGYSPSDAAVAVTRGALQHLNRDELQGVIAHEFSHVLNGDMRLNIHLMGVLFGILMLGVIGRKLIGTVGSSGLGRRRGGIGPVAVMLGAGLAAIIIGAVGVFFARLIKAAVSRQREVLADASAVQFTRNNAGLAGALKKIAGLQEGSQLTDRAGAEEVSHMLFGEGFAYRRWFATHPPMIERIARLEPGFSALHLKLLQQRWQHSPPDGLDEDRVLGLASPGTSRAAVQAWPGQATLAPQAVSAQVANPGTMITARHTSCTHRCHPPCWPPRAVGHRPACWSWHCCSMPGRTYASGRLLPWPRVLDGSRRRPCWRYGRCVHGCPPACVCPWPRWRFLPCVAIQGRSCSSCCRPSRHWCIWMAGCRCLNIVWRACCAARWLRHWTRLRMCVSAGGGWAQYSVSSPCCCRWWPRRGIQGSRCRPRRPMRPGCSGWWPGNRWSINLPLMGCVRWKPCGRCSMAWSRWPSSWWSNHWWQRYRMTAASR